jgi:hypothetical protein
LLSLFPHPCFSLPLQLTLPLILRYLQPPSGTFFNVSLNSTFLLVSRCPSSFSRFSSLPSFYLNLLLLLPLQFLLNFYVHKNY